MHLTTSSEMFKNELLNNAVHQLCIESTISTLAPAQDDAFFVCDIGKIVKQLSLWKQNLPDISPFYAVKCNEDPKLLQVLAALGLGFDCASKGEISHMLKLGVGRERLLYANPCKQVSHIKFAASNEVLAMTFDSECELKKIHKHCPTANLILRIATDDSSSVCQLGMKFGANISDCYNLIAKAVELDLNVVGVSFHVGSGCLDAEAYETAIKNASYVLKLANQFGYKAHILDIGGGFPGYPGEHDSDVTFEKIADVITKSIARHVTPNWSDITIIAEPGRFFATSAFTLATSVINIKEPSNAEGDTAKCYINDGVYGSFNCIMFDHAHVTPKWLPSTAGCPDGEQPLRQCSLWGPSCDGLDQIRSDCWLPAGLAPGDWLYFENMGAYTLSASSCFNGFPKPQLHYYIEQSTIKDMEELMYKPLSLDAVCSRLPASEVEEEEEPCGAEDSDLSYEEQLVLEQTLPYRGTVRVRNDSCSMFLPMVSF